MLCPWAIEVTVGNPEKLSAIRTCIQEIHYLGCDYIWLSLLVKTSFERRQRSGLVAETQAGERWRAGS